MSPASELTLFVDAAWVSPYALSAFVALEEKGLPYALRELDLGKREHQAASYRARTGRVPSLQHGDFVLAESSAIAEYLEDAFPPPQHPRLYPGDVQERAVARELQAWLRSDLGALREERPTTTVFGAPASTPLSPKAQAAAARLADAVGPLLAHGRATLFAQWCIADVDLALMLQRLVRSKDPLPATLAAFAEAVWRRPSVAKWVQHPRRG
ncbi:MAG: glutathione transferase [Deltaproteobacteria bacterium]|nr:glutathione transferase [Deltaproteobacteria bacterium]